MPIENYIEQQQNALQNDELTWNQIKKYRSGKKNFCKRIILLDDATYEASCNFFYAINNHVNKL